LFGDTDSVPGRKARKDLIDFKDKKGRTALHIAAGIHGHFDLASFLLAAGSTVDIKDKVRTIQLVFSA
jgi:ankyrin repeat protein